MSTIPCASRTASGFTIVIAAALLACGASSFAAVRTDSPSASSRMSVVGAQGAVQTVAGGNFSFFAWIRPTSLSASESAFFEVEGGLHIHILQNGSFRARLLSNGSPGLQATLAANLKTNEWALIAMSYNAGTGSITLWSISESQSLKTTSATTPGFVIGPLGTTATVGSFGGAPAMLGVYGATALRNHTITATDVTAVWNSRLHHGAYSINNLAQGGSLNGPEGCKYMLNHAVTTRPMNHSGGSPVEIAAVVGGPTTRRNYHIYDRTSHQSPTSLRAVRHLTSSTGFTNCSPYDPPMDGFFVKPLPQLVTPLPEPHYVPGDAPLLRRLATTPPTGGLRVMTSANSRAVQSSDGSESGTGNYAHGFIMLNYENTAGILNRPARIGPGEPWFGFDLNQNAAFTQGDVSSIGATNFSRFWTASFSSSAIGPGEGLRLAPGATYILRCKPDGMILAGEPLIMQAYLLRYPGASSVTWTPNLHSKQGEAGTNFASGTTINLNTQTWSHTLSASAGDSVPNAGRIILGGNHAANISIGHAVQTGSCISLVSAVSYNAGTNKTTIDFEHPFSAAPVMGSVLRFGPWGVEVIEYQWPGVNPATPWRGLRLAAGGSGQGAIVYAFSAWRPSASGGGGASGYIFGTAGWAGWGYWRQIDRSFDAALTKWMQILAPDVWLQLFAQQASEPLHMSMYLDRIREALPNIEVAWLGDYEHEAGGTQEEWHHYILNNAASENVIAITALMDERIGSFDALLDDGLRSDTNHINERGNIRLAEVWTDMLLAAATDPEEPEKIGDLNNDGVVDIFDLLIVLAEWGPCPDPTPGNCPADLDGSGVVDIFDLLIVLANWG